MPLEARIVSACDAFNAMTTTRSYRKAMPLREAMAEAERCAGTHFDPDVVGALLRAVALEAAPAAGLGANTAGPEANDTAPEANRAAPEANGTDPSPSGTQTANKRYPSVVFAAGARRAVTSPSKQ